MKCIFPISEHIRRNFHISFSGIVKKLDINAETYLLVYRIDGPFTICFRK